MSQTRKQSIIESLSQVIISYGLGVLTNYIVLPLFGLIVDAKSSFGIALIFSCISLIRSYMIRRLFTRIFK